MSLNKRFACFAVLAALVLGLTGASSAAGAERSAPVSAKKTQFSHPAHRATRAARLSAFTAKGITALGRSMKLNGILHVSATRDGGDERLFKECILCSCALWSHIPLCTYLLPGQSDCWLHFLTPCTYTG